MKKVSTPKDFLAISLVCLFTLTAEAATLEVGADKTYYKWVTPQFCFLQIRVALIFNFSGQAQKESNDFG